MRRGTIALGGLLFLIASVAAGDCVNQVSALIRVEPEGNVEGTPMVTWLTVNNLTQQQLDVPWQIWKDGVLVASGAGKYSPGARMAGKYLWTATAGSHNFQAVVDPQVTLVNECLPDNTSAVLTVPVPKCWDAYKAQRVNLAIGSLGLYHGANTNVEVLASGFISQAPWELWHNGKLIATGTTDLPYGNYQATVVARYPWIATSGSNNFQAVLGHVSKGDCPQDNLTPVVTSVVPACFLRSHVDIDARPPANTNQLATVSVSNLSPNALAIPWQLWKDGYLVKSATTTVPAGQSMALEPYSWRSTSGSHNFQAVADPSNTLGCAGPKTSDVRTASVPVCPAGASLVVDHNSNYDECFAGGMSVGYPSCSSGVSVKVGGDACR